MMALKDKIAIVTGGGVGIGAASAIALCEAGATVVVADIDAAAAGEMAKAIYKHDNNGMFTVDELIETVPASLMAGIPNIAPAEDA